MKTKEEQLAEYYEYCRFNAPYDNIYTLHSMYNYSTKELIYEMERYRSYGDTQNECIYKFILKQRLDNNRLRGTKLKVILAIGE